MAKASKGSTKSYGQMKPSIVIKASDEKHDNSGHDRDEGGNHPQATLDKD